MSSSELHSLYVRGTVFGQQAAAFQQCHCEKIRTAGNIRTNVIRCGEKSGSCAGFPEGGLREKAANLPYGFWGGMTGGAVTAGPGASVGAEAGSADDTLPAPGEDWMAAICGASSGPGRSGQVLR